MTVEFSTWHTINVVIVIPGKFRPGADVVHGEKCYPRKSQVMRVHKNALDENVGLATVLREKKEHKHEMMSL